MAATLESVESYLTAAQTAFASGDYVETERQVILGQMEIVKLPSQSGVDGENEQNRLGIEFQRLLDHIEKFRKRRSRGTRRSVAGDM